MSRLLEESPKVGVRWNWGKGIWRWLMRWWRQNPQLTKENNTPLFNNLVLKLVYKNLDFSDKKTFRLVCKDWLDSSIVSWRKQSKVVIKKKPPGIPINLFHFLDKNNIGSAQFGFYKISEYPVLNLAIKREKTSYNKKNQKDLFIPFEMVYNAVVEQIGHSLETLETSGYPALHTTQVGPYFKRLLLNDFPKLKVLSIEFYYSAYSKFSETTKRESFERTHADNLETLNVEIKGNCLFEEITNSILNLMPNIKKLQLRGIYACEDFLIALNSPENQTGKQMLESITINSMSNSSDFSSKDHRFLHDYLEIYRPPLKTLKSLFTDHKLPTGDGKCPFLCKTLLSPVESTLTCIDWRVIVADNSWFRVLVGCSLPNLTHFFIRFRDMLEGDQNLLFDFATLKGTPRLKVLHLNIELPKEPSKRKLKTVRKLEENNLTFSNEEGPILIEYLKDFRFELYHKPTANCWRALAGMMPNVQYLQSILDEETFPLVFNLWPELKHCSLSQNSKELIRMKTIIKMQKERGQTTKTEFGGSCKEDDWDKW